jgi:hypothetical protein
LSIIRIIRIIIRITPKLSVIRIQLFLIRTNTPTAHPTYPYLSNLLSLYLSLALSFFLSSLSLSLVLPLSPSFSHILFLSFSFPSYHFLSTRITKLLAHTQSILSLCLSLSLSLRDRSQFGYLLLVNLFFFNCGVSQRSSRQKISNIIIRKHRKLPILHLLPS